MSIPRLDEPAGAPTPYILPGYSGENITLPGSKSVVRILASAKETEQLTSVFKMDGVTGDPVGFHYHDRAHDVFTCTRGSMKVSFGDQSRILGPGDFAYVPPGVVHSPQLISPVTETLGLVSPGEWVDFFRFVSEKHDGAFAPEFDDRNTMQHLFPKFQEIKQKYDVNFVPHHKGGEVAEWTNKDHVLPSGQEPYYLQADCGPCFLLGGVLSRPFITTAQNNGIFAISSIEGSSLHDPSILAKQFSFSKVHQVYYVLDGAISVTVDGKDNLVRSGETVFIPKGTPIQIRFVDRYVRFWAFSSGNGLEALISTAGQIYKGRIVPDQPETYDHTKVAEIAQQLDVVFDAQVNGVNGSNGVHSANVVNGANSVQASDDFNDPNGMNGL